MIRRAFLMICLASLAGCAETLVDEPVESLGEFNMRVNYVFAEKAVKGPVSRDATPAEWTEAIENAVNLRLARYTGTQEYDIGISLEGYMLAPPACPSSLIRAARQLFL